VGEAGVSIEVFADLNTTGSSAREKFRLAAIAGREGPQ
jgi:hypothetical protein